MATDHQSIRYHLSYPRQATVFTWAECACLARCLGYREQSIELCYRQAVDARRQADGFQLSQLGALLSSKFFKSGFDFSYNSHSCEWNEQAVRRAVEVLAGRGMTFQQLHTTRLAYGLYESSDLRGLKAKPRTIARALRACGRAISLGKMAHRVRHMRFQEPGRLQLDEFIDLALWAGPLDREEAKSALPAASQGTTTIDGVHQLVNFDDLMTPLDGRIQRRLDAEYRLEERRYVREKVRPDNARLRECSVLGYRQARLARSREARAAYEPLLRLALRPATAATMATRTTKSGSSNDEEETDYEEPADGSLSQARDDDRAKLERRPRTAPLVTARDLAETELQMDALDFQTSALAEVHARRIAGNMQTLRPGFDQRHASRVEAAAAEAAAARRAADAAAADSATAEARARRLERRRQRQMRFVELANREEPVPLPSHGRVCDAATTERQRPATAPTPAAPVISAETARRTRLRKQQQRQQQQLLHQLQQSKRTKAEVNCDESNGSDDFWLEPRLGLPLPLTSPPSRWLTVSRLNYARSCPPRVHPVAIEVGGESPRSATPPEGQEMAELIQRVVYA